MKIIGLACVSFPWRMNPYKGITWINSTAFIFSPAINPSREGAA